MRIMRGFRFELEPNRETVVSLKKHIGAARFAYNWGLARCKEALERGERVPSAFELSRMWNRWKRENAPWWVEVSKCAPQEAFRDLEQAFRNWRAGQSGFPRFKRKKSMDDNKARLRGSIRVFPRHIQLPRIGKVRVKEPTHKLHLLLQEGKARILSATVSREADRWFVSLTVEVEYPDPQPLPPDAPVVGVDVGLDSYATLHDGRNPEHVRIPEQLQHKLARLRKKLRREQRRLSRKQREREVPDPNNPNATIKVFGKNYVKQLLRLQRVHRKIRNAFRDFLHQTTTRLAKAKRVYVVEDLSIKGLMRKRKRGYRLSRSIAEASWGEFLRMLRYKAEWYGSRVIIADRFYPSSKTCSACGFIRSDLRLSDRIFICPHCGFTMDRDVNAAINLRHYGLATLNGPTARSAGSHACGDPSGGGTAKAGLRATGRRSRKDAPRSGQ